MKTVLLFLALAILTFESFGQSPRFDIDRETLKPKTLVILDMDSLISQKDSLKIYKKWKGSGISFEASTTISEQGWSNENNVFVARLNYSPATSVFALVPGGKYAKALVQKDSIQPSDLKIPLQFILVDADKKNLGLEPTFVMSLCDLINLAANSENIEKLNSKLLHKEWLIPFEAAILDANDVSKVYRFQSELDKIDIHSLVFSDSTSFFAPAKSERGGMAYADRQILEYKGTEYIINYIYTIGQGLTFYNIEPRNKVKSSAQFSRSYLQYLFQPKPMKAGAGYKDQQRDFLIPQRQ